MVYDDVVKPAVTGTTNAKHGGGVILTPGITINQAINAGKLKPIAVEETRLNNRFDDTEYYGAAPEGGGGAAEVSSSPSLINNGFSCDTGWFYPSPDLLSTSNDSYVIAGDNFGFGYCTDGMIVRGFGFAIPANATITGIKVEIEKRASKASVCKDNGVRLSTNGTSATGNNLGDTSSFWPTVDTYSVYGADGQLWGVTLTPNIVNSANFGIEISANCFSAATIYIDHVRVTVYYTT